MGRFEFVRLSSLRAAQLIGGCTPRVAASCKPTTTARREVMQGKVCRLPRIDAQTDAPPEAVLTA
jgi:DNA-directed RNA polymerase subunit K/omega